MRILFTSAPMRGHLYPLIPVAWAARSAGHQIMMATSDSFLATVTDCGLPAMSCGPADDFIGLVNGQPAIAGQSLSGRRRLHGRAFARIARQKLAGTRALIEAWQPDLVVSERAESAGPLAAAEHGRPYVEFQWGVALLDEYRAAAAEEFAAELTELQCGRMPSPSFVLNPWPAGLRLPHAASHQGIGETTYNGPAQVPSWVFEPASRPRICLTFGTVAPRLPGAVGDLIVPLLKRLSRLGGELLVAADPEAVAGWPALPAAVTQVGQLPLSQLLPTCDLLVNHGGQGTVLTALVAACPQLVLPQFDDQFDNADAVVRSGAGLAVPPGLATLDLITQNCQDLLSGTDFEWNAGRVAGEIRSQPSPAQIVALLEQAAVPAARKISAPSPLP